jgi:hypothetical protein
MSDEPEILAVERAERVTELQNAVGEFMTAFAAVESFYLTVALVLLSNDQPLIEHLEELMDFSDRLKLMVRLTEERYPALAKDARAINSAGKNLAEHRNRIAHGAASVIAGSMEPGAPFAVGIRKRKSERKVPPDFKTWAEEAEGLMRKWYITADEVMEHTVEAVRLQAQMRALHGRLQTIRYPS